MIRTISMCDRCKKEETKDGHYSTSSLQRLQLGNVHIGDMCESCILDLKSFLSGPVVSGIPIVQNVWDPKR